MLILILLRIYFLVSLIFFLNGISSLIFKPSTKTLKKFILCALFSMFWILSIFSAEGRNVLLSKGKEL